jgi:hypothetical protein
MSLIRNLLLAGIVAGVAAPALGQALHEETVQIGPNMVEQIYYTGNVAPQVTMQAMPAAALLAAMAQQQEAMAAQTQQMLQQAAALLNAPMTAPAMPVITAASSGGACVTSMSFVQVNGEKPQVTEYSSPGCGAAAPAGAAAVQPTELQPARAPAVPTPRLIQARLATPTNEDPSG